MKMILTIFYHQWVSIHQTAFTLIIKREKRNKIWLNWGKCSLNKYLILREPMDKYKKLILKDKFILSFLKLRIKKLMTQKKYLIKDSNNWKSLMTEFDSF